MCGAELHTRTQAAWAVLAEVPDPEVPAISVCDLGIVRDVEMAHDGQLTVVLTPTYSGCPATEVITESVLAALDAAGLGPALVRMQRAPAWTTDWISPAGRDKLRAYGIAPPGPVGGEVRVPMHLVGGLTQSAARSVDVRLGSLGAAPTSALACPRCDSTNTERLSAFGSTACKALYRCLACREPFEHFKPI